MTMREQRVEEIETEELQDAVAVVGFAGRFPAAGDVDQLWRNLLEGREGLTRLSDDELLAAGVDADRLRDPAYVKAAMALEGIEEFDAELFGMSPREAAITDPQHRLLLQCAHAALEHAGLDPGREEGGGIGVFAGTVLSTYLLFNLFDRRSGDPVEDWPVVVANSPDTLASRIAYKLDLRGPALSVQTACSTSLVAVHLARKSLIDFECDAALAGGVTVRVPNRRGYAHEEGGIRSPDGRCRAFDAEARGTVFGSGAGLVVLKRLEDALADGDTVHAVIRGSAVNNDGAAKVGFTAPGVDGQSQVVLRALADAEVEPETIGLVEAHGTGTPLGDPIEVRALTQAFRTSTEARGFCALGSIKSHVGHLDAAAGVAGLLKAVLAVKHATIPGTLHFRTPNPALGLEESPFWVPTETTPWPPGARPRRAGVSSFGIGGTNAHVVLEEPPPRASSGPSRPFQLLCWSAQTEAALERATSGLADFLRESGPEVPLPDVASTLHRGRRRYARRCTLLCRDSRDALEALVGENRERVHRSREGSAVEGVAFLFPGQGAQHVRMGWALYRGEPVFRRAFDRCAAILRPHLGHDLAEVLYPASGSIESARSRLDATEISQPALFAVEYALAQLWRSWGVEPRAMVGHSVGEYVAACLAGVFTLEGGLGLVAARGRLMTEMPAGAMLAVELSEEDLLARLEGTEADLAAVNAPGRTVAAGAPEAIAALRRRLEEDGLAVRPLPARHAFHSRHADPLLERFAAEVARVGPRRPELPFASTLTGRWIEPGEAADPGYWTRHLRHTVRFEGAVAKLLHEPACALLEVGPGRTLGSLARRHPSRRSEQPVLSSLPHRDGEGDAQAAVLEALGRLWAAGAAIDWDGFYDGEDRHRIPLPTYPFEKTRHWIDAPPSDDRTARGTLLAAAASEPARGASPAAAETSATEAAELSEAERRVAAVWREVLGVTPGPEDDFFELGGDSLLGLQLISRLRRDVAVPLDVRILFENPTLGALARALEPRCAEAAPDADDSLRRRPEAGPVPLSFNQHRLWFLDRLAPGGSEYNETALVEVAGQLDLGALGTALAAAVGRHEVLRTSFREVDGAPVQEVASAKAALAAGAPLLPVVDLSRLPAERAREESLGATAVRESLGFRLTELPLVRCSVIREAEDRHLLALTLHHVICDAWSMGVLTRDLGALYRQAVDGERPRLPPLPVQYSDFARWQRERLAPGELEGRLAWWRNELAQVPTVLELPTDRPRPPVRSSRGARVTFSLPPARLEPLDAYRRRRGATRFMVVLALLEGLLARLSGQERFCIGSPAAGRDREELESLVGLFVNTVVVPAEVRSGESFDRLVERVRERMLAALPYQDTPFEHLVEALSPDRDLSRTPIFQVLLAFQNVPRPEWPVPELRLRPIERRAGSAKFDLSLYVTEREEDGVLGCTLEYASDLFDRSTVERLARQLVELARSATAEPGRPLSELPLAPPAEHHQALVEWNDTATPREAAATLPGLLTRQARETPERVAVVTGEEQVSYAELGRRVAALARALRRHGVGPQRRVGVSMERSVELVVALAAVAEAGGAYVPLDPSYPQARLAGMVADARVAMVLCQADLRDRVEGVGAPVRTLGEVMAVPGAGCSAAAAGPGPDDLLYVIYTSGSTGRPKGVAVSHAAVVNRLQWGRETEPLDGTDAVLQKTPYGFDVSVWELFWPLLSGARLVMARPGAQGDPRDLVETVARERVTTIHFVPSMLRAFVDEPRLPQLRTLRRVIASGEALGPDLAARFLARSPARLYNLYGPTEAAIEVTSWRCRAGEPVVPIGRPIANLRVHVVDAAGYAVALGAPAELRIAGAGLARGYLDRPGRTAASFVPDPYAPAPGGRQYRSGDLVRRRADGAIEYLGRLDHQVKLRGFRIELGEIEAALERLPAISAAVVSVRRERLIAHVVREDDEADPATLAAELARELPGHMIPALFVPVDALPVTANGKVDRDALPAPVEPEAPPASLPGSGTEAALADLWAQLLGRETVGVDDDFFALGGHSILATRVIARVRQVFGTELPLRTFFEAPTVARLARAIETAARAVRPAIVPTPRDEALPLSFSQERLWFLARLDPRSVAYNIPFAIRLVGELEVPRLAAAARAVVDRHEALRTRFADTLDGPVQRVEPEGGFRLPVVDLGRPGGPARERAARLLASREAATPFDLETGPLLRVVLARLAARDHLLVGTMHHAISDAWSIGVLTREIGAFYRGETPPELPVQFGDYARWQRSWLAGEALAREVSWWRETLAEVPSVLDLPTDRPRPRVPSERGAALPIRFARPLVDRLSTTARGRGATLFMVVLASVQALLARFTGQPELVIGAPVSGRDRAETEGLIGFFVNTLALPGDVSGDPSFEDLLARVRATVLGAYAHQDLPFETLVQELGVARDSTRPPLVQVMLAFQNAPAGPLELPGLEVTLPRLRNATAQLELTLSLVETAEGLEGDLEYRVDLFDRTTVERLARQLDRVLAYAAERPEAPLSAAPWLARGERHQLLVEWNEAAGAALTPGRLGELVRSTVARVPDALAVVCEGDHLTYGELADRAGRLAAALVRAGAGPEHPVALLSSRSPSMAVGLLAALECGAPVVPLDRSLPPLRLATILEEAGAAAVLTDGILDPDTLGGGRVVLRSDVVSPLTARPLPRPSLDDAAYIVFTSGTTGRPKGVAVSHRDASLHLLDWAVATGGGDRVLQFASIGFDVALEQLLAPWLRGACVVLRPDEVWASEELIERLAEERVTVADLPNAVWHELAATGRTLPPSLRRLSGGGEAMLATACATRTAVSVPELLNAYGPTEGVITATVHRVAAGSAHTAGPSGTVPIGRPLRGRSAYAVGPDLRPVPVGVAGELLVSGPAARGYWRLPSPTAAAFVPDPFGRRPGSRLYRTGDLVRRLPDGELEFLGRVDRQVKLRGFRIEIGEIESTLLRQPGVSAAAATLRTEGDREPTLVAHVAGAGEALDEAELRHRLGAELPAYMVPSAIVVLEELPRTANGKIDRSALPAPEVPRPRAATEPRTETERRLAEIWCEVLELERVGVDEDFFALGGHSLLATRVASRVRRGFDRAVPVRVLFERPTIAGLAAWIVDAEREEQPAIVPSRRTAAESGALPLSFVQERLWFLDRFEPGNTSLNMPAAVRLRGVLDLAVLRRALAEVVRRHEVLRSRYAAEGGRPRAIVEPPIPPALPVVDLRRAPGELGRVRALDAASAFDLGRGPLLRALVARLGPDDHALVLCFHHIVSDGWSTSLVIREATELYRAFSAGRPSPLPELAIQYADYAAWQRRSLGPERLEPQLAYWRRRLAGAPRALELPVDRPRPPVQTFRGERLSTVLGRRLSERIRGLARDAGATPFMALLAAFQLLLHRLSGRDDLLVGTPVAGRDRPEVEPLIGCFLGTLVLRSQLDRSSSFGEHLVRVRRTVLEAFENQDVPFERLLEDLRPERDLSRTPLFQVFFNMLNLPEAAVDLPGLECDVLSLPEARSKFDLTLYAQDREEGIRFDWVWNAELFDRVRIEEMAAQLELVLEQIALDPRLPVERLSLVTARARATLPDPAERLDATWRGAVHEQFRAAARRHPDRIATASATGSFSYAAVARWTDAVAEALRNGGVSPGDVVAIYAHRGPELAPAVLGALAAGGTFVILDPAYPAARLEAIVRQAEPRAWLALTAAGPPPERLARCLEALPTALRIEVERLAEPCDAPPELAPLPDSPACLGFTSGSTGTPKGIVGRHGPLTHFLEWSVDAFGLREDDRYAMLSGLAHDPLQRDLFTPLATGATIAVPDPERMRLPGWIAGWAARERVSVAHLTPAMGRLILEGADGAEPLTSLRRAFFVGEALQRRHVERFLALAPAVRCWNSYGSTETQRAVAYHRIERAAGRAASGSLPLGRGLCDVQLLVTAAGGGAAGVGEPGELWMRSPHLAGGYLADPARTADRFRPDGGSRVPGARLFVTGDLGRYLPDGEVEFAGRVDRQVQIRGFRVEPGEIESLLTTLPGVSDAAVVTRQQEDDLRLVAYVVAGGTVDTAEMRRRLSTELPSYMLPSAFVALDALPLSPNGKLDERGLPEPEWGSGRAAPNLPTTTTEELLAAIWEEVLGRPQVGTDEDFFALGGHSLLATRLAARVRDSFGVEIPLRAIFEEPTVRALARRIERAARAEQPPIVPVLRTPETRLPLSFGQERLWFLDRLDPGSTAYHLPYVLRLRGRLESARLGAALSAVVRRHEVLRTRVVEDEDGLHQRIDPPRPRGLPLIDLARLEPGDRDASARRCAVEATRRPFDLGRGQVMRTVLLRLGAEEHVLAGAMHHAVADGWSIGILARELSELYRGVEPPAPTVQYADFAAWQRGWLTDETLAAELGWWRGRLDGAPRVLELPVDRPRPPVRPERGAEVPVALPPALVDELSAFGRSHGATLFMVLLAGFQAVLARYSGQDDLLVGSPVANRPRAEVEPLIGFFVNTLVLRGDLRDDPTLDELVDRCRETTLAAYAHQNLPFEKLVEDLDHPRDPTRSPFVQAAFGFQQLTGEALDLPGLETRWERAPASSVKFDLAASLARVGNGVVGSFEYAVDLFDGTTVDRLTRGWTRLLEGMREARHLTVGQVPLLGGAERHQILVEWNDTGARQAPCDLFERFAAHARVAPDAIALAWEGEQVCYGTLLRRASELARRLRGLGVERESRVAVCLPAGPRWIEAVLGVLAAGGAYVPLDPDQPAARLGRLRDEIDPAATIVAAGDLGRGEPRLVLDRPPAEAARETAGGRSARQAAYVLFTSGSTGRPKGVCCSDDSVLELLEEFQRLQPIGPGDRGSFWTRPTFDVSVYEIFSALTAGATLCGVPRARRLDGRGLAAWLADQRITSAYVPPFHVAELEEAAATLGASALRRLLVGVEPIPEERLIAIAARTPGLVVINGYGPTEATVCCTLHPIDPWSERSGRTPIGRPVRNQVVHLMDARLRPVPLGARGELCTGGGGLARAYEGAPRETAPRFVPDPLSRMPGSRLYRTGDLARRLEGGALEFVGRVDHQLKVRGHRIEPAEIEAELLVHPEVAEAVVVVREDRPGVPRLVAYVVSEEGAAPEGAVLRRRLEERLPAYMVPAVVMVIDALPLTASDKVDRSALPAPEDAEGAGFIAPRTALEARLSAIWESVLEIDRVGAEDDFHALGGHSLLATRIVHRASRELGLEVPLGALLRTPTVAGMARAVQRLRRGVAAEGSLAERIGADALLPADVSPAPPRRRREAPREILLTGATGFLGSFLLVELLERTEATVHCLVRAGGEDAAWDRLRSSLASYGLGSALREERVRLLCGDLSRPALGLASADRRRLVGCLDAIYHNGALVNFTYPYESLRAANVTGTLEVLRLAADAGAHVHHVSTLSVFGATRAVDGVLTEEHEPASPAALDRGYAQSKWVAERLLAQAAERGLGITLYRPGRVTGHSRTGAASTTDVTARSIKGYLQLGLVPRLGDSVDLTPVDYVAAAIVHLSLQPWSEGRTYHLFNPRPFAPEALREVLATSGFALREVPLAEWTEAMRRLDPEDAERNSLRPLLRLAPPGAAAETVDPAPPVETLPFDCSRTQDALAGSGIACPPADAALLRRYLRFFIERGFLPAPLEPTAPA